MVQTQKQTKTMLFTQSETLSMDTEKTILASHTRPPRTTTTTKNGSQTPLEQVRPSSKMLPMSTAPSVAGLQRVQQWVTSQSTAPCCTPPVSVIQTMSRTQTEVSTLPLNHEASRAWPRHSSQSITRSRHSRHSSRSMATVADAMLNFGNQMTSSLMHLADQHRLDAMEREKMALERKQMR